MANTYIICYATMDQKQWTVSKKPTRNPGGRHRSPSTIDERPPAHEGSACSQSGTKVVFISGDDGIQQESVKAGAAVFLKKPADIKLIRDTVTQLMNA